MSRYYRDMDKVIRVIKSCETIGQIKYAGKMLNLFALRWPQHCYMNHRVSMYSCLLDKYHTIS